VSLHSAVFRALSDATRLRLLKVILLGDRPVCVCELADALGLPQYQVSRHLAVLRQAGLVVDSRIGTWVYYSVPQDPPAFVRELYGLIGRHVTGTPFDGDGERLEARLALREDGRCVVGPGRAGVAAPKKEDDCRCRKEKDHS